jgi:hypothetical protein
LKEAIMTAFEQKALFRFQIIHPLLDDMRISIPYPILGLDSNNGSEFMNRPVLHWTEEQGIAFTWGRPSTGRTIIVS